MHGRLARGEFVKLAYRLGRGAATGLLEVVEASPRARHRVYLRRGYLTAARLEGHWAPLGELLREAGAIDGAQLRRSLEAVAAAPTLQGAALRAQGASAASIEAALRRQAELRLERLAAIADGEYRLDAHAPPPPAAAGGTPLALVAWARRHVEARVDAARARAIMAELAGARLILCKHLAPDPIVCDDTDRRILAALASPRRLDELEQAAHAPRYRLLAFVHFLRTVGAVEASGVAAGAPAPRAPDPLETARRVLGVPPDADAEAVKRAYRRLARAFHPDAHPEAAPDARRALAARFAAITQAYHRLARSP